MKCDKCGKFLKIPEEILIGSSVLDGDSLSISIICDDCAGIKDGKCGVEGCGCGKDA